MVVLLEWWFGPGESLLPRAAVFDAETSDLIAYFYKTSEQTLYLAATIRIFCS
jgi:hypothetical protein